MPAQTAAEIRSRLNGQYRQLAPALANSISQTLGSILPQVPSLKGQNTGPLAKEIAETASKDILESLGKIQGPQQIPQAIADGLYTAIEANAGVNPNLEDINLNSAYKQIVKQSEGIAKQFGELESHAALRNINDRLELSTPKVSQLISEEAASFAQESEPITPEETAKKLVKHVDDFSEKYRQQLGQQVAILLAKGKAPTLEDVQSAKEKAYQNAYAAMEAGINEKNEYKEHLRDFSENVLPLVGYKPFTPKQVEEMGLGTAEPKLNSFLRGTKFSATGVGLALASSPRAQKEAFYSLLVHNRGQFEQDLREVEAQVKGLGANKARTYQENKAYVNARKRYAVLSNAQRFAQNSPGKVQTYIDTFQSMEAGYRAGWAARSARMVTTAFTGGYPAVGVPYMSAQARDAFMSNRFFGNLAFRKGSFSAGNAKALMKVAKGANPEVAIITSAAGPILNGLKKVVGLGIMGLFGLGMYFLALGKAIFTGFVIGAGVGGTVGLVAGGFIGFQIGLALAPFTFGLSIPVFTLLGAGVGATLGAVVGGLAGGMIALGLQTGSTAALGTGVGAGVGGTVGGIVGFNIGAGLTAAVMTGVIGICIGSVVCAPFAPILIAVSPAIVWGGGLLGGMVGAAVGTAVGAAVGYLVGNYVMPFFSSMITSIKSFFSGAFGAGTATAGGILGAIGGFFTGAAATLWGGLVGAGGGILGGLASIGGALWGGIGSLGAGTTVTFSAIAAPIGITVLAAGAITTALGSMLNTATPAQAAESQNEFFTVAKTASPTQFQNADITQPKEVTFHITLETKGPRLTNITVIDNLTVTGHPQITTDINNNPITTPCGGVPNNTIEPGDQPWSCDFKIETQADWRDSLVTNTVTVQATPEGQTTPTIGSATAIVRIGEPKNSCPQGWPTTGHITQGPDGGSSHGDNATIYGGMEALDIGTPIGTPVYSTISGVIVDVGPRGAYNGFVYIAPQGCPNLNVVGFVHLKSSSISSLRRGQAISFGQQIAESGDPTCDGGPCAHIHYQFNYQWDERLFRMEVPNIPEDLPQANGGRACNGDCGITINSAPF